MFTTMPVAAGKSRTASPKLFTLIELLVVTSQLCRDFFKRFICTDKYGCVRKHTENAALKNTPHHTCKANASCTESALHICRHFITQTVFAPAKTCSLFLTLRRPAGYGGQEGKTSPYNTCRANASCTAHNAVFAPAKTFSLFLKRREGCGERGKTSFPGKRSFSSLPTPLSPFQEKRISFC